MVKLCWAEIILHICDLITCNHSFLLNLRPLGLLLDADNMIFGIHVCDRAVPLNPLDLAIAVGGEADRELTCVTFTYHGIGRFYETSVNLRKSLVYVMFKKFNVQFIERNGN